VLQDESSLKYFATVVNCKTKTEFTNVRSSAVRNYFATFLLYMLKIHNVIVTYMKVTQNYNVSTIITTINHTEKCML